MVLGGRVNREIVELVNRAGGRAIGLTGNDGIDAPGAPAPGRRARPRPRRRGRSRSTRTRSARWRDAGFVPVVAPLGVDADGLTYNVNADEAAGAIARALARREADPADRRRGREGRGGRLISRLTRDEVRKLIGEGTIQGGMIPKVECCLDALAGGVERAHIIDGRILHAVLLEIFTDGGVGTLITR